MTSMNISLSDSLKDYVDSIVSTEGYSTSSEYIRELIRNDQKRRDEEKLTKLLLEGLEGEPVLMDAEFFARKRKELLGDSE